MSRAEEALKLLEIRPGIWSHELPEELGISLQGAPALYAELVERAEIELRTANNRRRLGADEVEALDLTDDSEGEHVFLKEDAPTYEQAEQNRPSKYHHRCERCNAYYQEDNQLVRLAGPLSKEETGAAGAFYCRDCQPVIEERNWHRARLVLPAFFADHPPGSEDDETWTEKLTEALHASSLAYRADDDAGWYLESLTKSRFELRGLELSSDHSYPELVRGKDGWRMERKQPSY